MKRIIASVLLAGALFTGLVACDAPGVHAQVCADKQTHVRLLESACEQELDGTVWRYYDGDTLVPRIGEKLPWGLTGSSTKPDTELTYIPSSGGTAKKTVG